MNEYACFISDCRHERPNTDWNSQFEFLSLKNNFGKVLPLLHKGCETENPKRAAKRLAFATQLLSHDLLVPDIMEKILLDPILKPLPEGYSLDCWARI